MPASSDVARAFGITEDELISDLDVLPMCGTSFRGGDLLDIDTDGERIWWRNPDALGSDTARAAAARRRRGDRAAGGRPRRRHPARDCARATGEALLRATAKLEAAAGESGGRQLPAVGHLRVRGRGLRGRRPGHLGAAQAVAALLLARRETSSPSARSTRSGCSPSGTPTWRPGAASPRRGAPSGSTGSRRSGCWTSRPTRRPDRAAGPVARGWCSPPPRTPRWSSRSARAGAGSPSTTRTTAPRSCPTAGCASPCAPPIPASLRRLALRLGRDGRIVSPRELADSARQAAREALAAYDVPAGDGGPAARAKPSVGEEPRVGEGLPEGPHGVQDGLYGRQEQEL